MTPKDYNTVRVQSEHYQLLRQVKRELEGELGEEMSWSEFLQTLGASAVIQKVLERQKGAKVRRIDY